MLIVFFDIKGVVMIEWVLRGQIVNQYYYLQVLTTLGERVRRKRRLSCGKATLGSVNGSVTTPTPFLIHQILHHVTFDYFQN